MAKADQVFVVDDDEMVRETVTWLLESVGLTAATFSSAQEFLEAISPQSRGCVILDLRMPKMGGLQLQAELMARGVHLPIIFLTGHGDISAAVRAMKQGAVDFVEKPFSNEALIEIVQKALREEREGGKDIPSDAEIDAEWADLTPREREVLQLLVSGHTNKEVSALLKISIKTVEYHRSNIMKKTGATSLSHLVRKTAQITLVTP